jgi:hypothetical protein
MKAKGIPQHKRIAEGGGHVALSYSRGGSIGVPVVVKASATKSPLTAARRNNGIRGMKGGGSTDKC